jgi:hypothetical protein
VSNDYGEDLAHIHDAGFGQMAAAAGPVLIDALRRSGHESGLVFEPLFGRPHKGSSVAFELMWRRPRFPGLHPGSANPDTT